MTYTSLTLILPLAVMLHVTEEFLFPGGFIEWYAAWRPPKAGGVRPGYLVWINTLMIGACIPPVHFGPTEQGVAIWYVVAAIAAANACFHVLGVFALRRYSPGVITGVALYIPIFAYGSFLLLSSGLLTAQRAIIAVVVAVGYHVWSWVRQGA